ncbi:MAG TPA: DeoR/GlpR family DNA-binding transcription regulator [Roseomonas sp.]|jgi:DeoR family glycerol-3-phosphate regulon repressor
MPLLGQPRRDAIMARLGARSAVRVGELADTLGVSPECIRRDLVALERRGLLVRVHGGAVPPPAAHLGDLQSRMRRLPDSKAAIAAVAVSTFVRADMNLFLGGGSTIHAVAEHLPQPMRLRVVTNMVDTAVAAAQGRHRQVVITGGTLHPDYHITMGEPNLATLRAQRFDLAMVSAHALEPERGATDPHEMAAEIAQTLCGSAREIVLLADRAKFARRSRFQSLPFERVTALVTDGPPPAPFDTILRHAKVRVIWPGMAREIPT